MTPFVFIFAAIAISGVIGVVITIKNKKSMPREVFAPKMTVYVSLTLIFTLMAVMTGIFTK